MAYQLTSKNRRFIDLSLTFTPNPVTKDLTVISDERAINNSIKNLVLIRPNEVPFARDIGSNVSNLLFDHCDDITASEIEEEISRTISFAEPRVELELVQVIAKPEQYYFEVTIKYKIIGTENVFTINQILTPTR